MREETVRWTSKYQYRAKVSCDAEVAKPTSQCILNGTLVIRKSVYANKNMSIVLVGSVTRAPGSRPTIPSTTRAHPHERRSNTSAAAPPGAEPLRTHLPTES